MKESRAAVAVADVGGGASTLLQVALIVLKLAEIGAVARWPWWWVLAPSLAATALALVAIGIGVVIALLQERGWFR